MCVFLFVWYGCRIVYFIIVLVWGCVGVLLCGSVGGWLGGCLGFRVLGF